MPEFGVSALRARMSAPQVYKAITVPIAIAGLATLLVAALAGLLGAGGGE